MRSPAEQKGMPNHESGMPEKESEFSQICESFGEKAALFARPVRYCCL
tara:strand:- start:292085 stop:292228 length:144 start_codon:yes stop_codon:yes gene_type:complete